MSAIFVDTSAWFALAGRRDEHHESATRTFRRLLGQRQALVTSNYVVSETYTTILARIGHDAAQEFLRSIRTSSSVQRVMVQEAWEQAVLEIWSVQALEKSISARLC